METLLAITIGAMVAGAVYLMLSLNVVRFLFGLVLLGNGVNLAIITVGRYGGPIPPLIPSGLTAPDGPVANALPHALILTAIVIGFGMLAFTAILLFRAYEALGTISSDEMRAAEPLEPQAGGH